VPTDGARALIVGCHIRSPALVLLVLTTNPGGTPMLESVFYTAVFVSDQDRALDFYTDVLG
jgi:Glyoxalase/Bleomycin resistance protein/Dioxygenase superfamily